MYLWTRMHSSRMRTGRSLTVCRSLLPRRGEGVSAPGGSDPRGVCSLGGWGVVSQHALRQTPPPWTEWMTDRCNNITLATTSLRPVIINNLSYEQYLETYPLIIIIIIYLFSFDKVHVSCIDIFNNICSATPFAQSLQCCNICSDIQSKEGYPWGSIACPPWWSVILQLQ